jgi:hypothetical protein
MKVRSLKRPMLKMMRRAKRKHRVIAVTYTEKYPKEFVSAMKDWVKFLHDGMPDAPPLYPAAVTSALHSGKPDAIRFAHLSYVKLGGKKINDKTSHVVGPSRLKHHAIKNYARRQKRWLKKNPPAFRQIPTGTPTPVFFSMG